MKHIALTAAALALVAACNAPTLPVPAPTEATPETPETWLGEQIKTARESHKLIAIGAVYATSDGIQDIAVAGLRKNNAPDRVQLGDAWHLGSNTKALTALLYARLVDQNKAQWGATLPELFPDLAVEIDPAWTAVTIEDLFAHNSGVGQLGGLWLIARRSDPLTLNQQRTETARATLSAPPQGTYGSFEYSNLNYIIAGAAIERILTADSTNPVSWEQGMQDMVFAALPDVRARDGWGFGPPSSGLEGHRKNLLQNFNPVGTGPGADNPQALGPAGTAHASLEAYALLATEFLRDDSRFLPVATREKLWAPHPAETNTYAMGWGVTDHADYGRIYIHNGSNTMWLSSIIIAPDLDLVAIVNLNQSARSLTGISRDIFADILEKVSAGRAD